jgi:hypothetical protein
MKVVLFENQGQEAVVFGFYRKNALSNSANAVMKRKIQVLPVIRPER